MKSFLKILLIPVLFYAGHAMAQAEAHVYYLNKKLRMVDKNKAVIIGKGVKRSDSVFTVNYYLAEDGRLLNTKNYTNSTLQYLNGKSISYDNKGRINIVEQYKNNVLDGYTAKYSPDGYLTDSILYANDKVLVKKEFLYSGSRLLVYLQTDSVHNTLQRIVYDTLGRVTSRVYFDNSNKGIRQILSTDGRIRKTDTLFSREIKYAGFKGGAEGWRRFLEQNLHAGIPVKNNAPNGTYTVVVRFIINTDGTVSDIKPVTKFGYGMEEEAVRVIQISNTWQPTEMFGEKIRAYRKQPITFKVVN